MISSTPARDQAYVHQSSLPSRTGGAKLMSLGVITAAHLELDKGLYTQQSA